VAITREEIIENRMAYVRDALQAIDMLKTELGMAGREDTELEWNLAYDVINKLEELGKAIYAPK
jgi:hypothetical protein